ncbi:ankyrin repeat-containing and signal peptide-containing protein [Cryptosporidium canis]|uniref:Ankyrin repeat-containing and signal peptide-containing protein n=1 Tax=Cryptosporidium canis TaxID=195482 RepID=A0A9D5DFM1_9CRYT|nr:ankyrin repeat-containing and signal peptide-containing protein [Cryptosporidium canis]
MITPKVKRKYGYKISEASKIAKSNYYSMKSQNKFEESMENIRSSLARYSGDRLSAPVQLLESITARDIGRFINISSFLSKIGYKFGKSKHSETALTAACKISGEIGYFFVSHLLSLGASADTYSEYGFTPLLLACKHQHKEVVRLLIEKGKSQVDCTDPDGRTPLFYAISQLDIGLVNYLLEKGANPNFRDILGNTPLIHALMVNFKEAVSVLLAFGAFPWIRNYTGFDPVTLAVLESRIDILPVLISSKRYPIEEFNIRKNIPEYHHSAARRLLLGIKYYIREQILLELLEIEISLENVMICSTSDQNGLTILWWACKLHYPKFIFRLLEFYIQARNLPEGHTCNPHKTGNNQIMPIELLITHLYNEEQPFGFSFRRRFMDLMFRGHSTTSSSPNIVLMNIFTLMFMLDPYSNRSFLIQALYSNRSIECLTKILFGIPMFNSSSNSNFQSISQMLIMIKKSELMNRFSNMIKTIVFILINSDYGDQYRIQDREDHEKEQLEQSVLLLTSKIICIVFKRDFLELNIKDLDEFFRKKALNPFIYPLLVIGETKSLEESNSLSISILRGNNLLTILLTNLFNQCIEQTTAKSLFKYKRLCIKAYNGALKLALKQYQPADSNSLFQKGVDLALFTLLQNRPKAFNDILLEIDYCKQSEEAIAFKLLQYVITVFLPKLSYSNKRQFNSQLNMNVLEPQPNSTAHLFKQSVSHPKEESIYDETFPLPFPLHTYSQLDQEDLSPLEFSTRTLMNFTCDVSTPRFVDLLLLSTWDSLDLLSNGVVTEKRLDKTLDLLLRSVVPNSAPAPLPLSLFALQILGFSPALSSFVLRKHQINEETKPFYNFVIKRNAISEAIINHPMFKSRNTVDNKIIAVLVITLLISILVLLTILIVSDSPSSYKKRYLRMNTNKQKTNSLLKSSNSEEGSVFELGQDLLVDNISNTTPDEESKSSQNSVEKEDPDSSHRSEVRDSNYNVSVHCSMVSSGGVDLPQSRRGIETTSKEEKRMRRSRLVSLLNRIWPIFDRIAARYAQLMVELSYFLSSKKRISPTFIIVNNLPIKSKSYLRAILFGLKCTYFGYDAFEDIFFRVRRLLNCKATEIQRKTNDFLIPGMIRLGIFVLSIYWLISCNSIDLWIFSIYLTLFSVISNASISLASVSIQERDRLFHLFVPSSLDLLGSVNMDNDYQGEVFELHPENQVDFSAWSTNQASSNVSPIYDDRIAHILDKYSDSLLTPKAKLLTSQISHSSPPQSCSPPNQNADHAKDPGNRNTEVISEKFWSSRLPSHKYWTLKDVFHEYYSIWMSSKHSSLLQTQNFTQSNSSMIYNADLAASCSSPNITMISQNPFEAINSCMIFSGDYVLLNTTNIGAVPNNHACGNTAVGHRKGANHNSGSQATNSNSSPLCLQNNPKSAEYTPVANSSQSQIQSVHLQNITIERHILSICQAEFIRPNDCRICLYDLLRGGPGVALCPFNLDISQPSWVLLGDNHPEIPHLPVYN